MVHKPLGGAPLPSTASLLVTQVRSGKAGSAQSRACVQARPTLAEPAELVPPLPPLPARPFAPPLPPLPPVRMLPPPAPPLVPSSLPQLTEESPATKNRP